MARPSASDAGKKRESPEHAISEAMRSQGPVRSARVPVNGLAYGQLRASVIRKWLAIIALAPTCKVLTMLVIRKKLCRCQRTWCDTEPQRLACSQVGTDASFTSPGAVWQTAHSMRDGSSGRMKLVEALYFCVLVLL